MLNWKPTLGRNKADYTATLKDNAQSKGVVGKASDANTGQNQKIAAAHKNTNNRYMSGEKLLAKAMGIK